jgi:probable F420-dependent oxidoreductase
VKVGVQYFPSAESMSPVPFAVAAQERGFESVFFPDHTHIPVAGRFPGGHEVAEHYRTVMDPIVVLGAVAAATDTIRLGTAVLLVTQRDPIILAKQLATLDHLSHGRLVVGVGAGSIDAEMRHHGIEPASRFAVLRERIEAINRIWTEEEAGYAGDHVSFEPIWSWPKPVQQPRPPILLGGDGPTVLRRALAYADGWMPFRGGMDQVFDPLNGEVEEFETPLAARIARLRQLAADASRMTQVTLFNPCPHPAALERYRAMGIDRVIFWLPTAGDALLLRTLDALAAMSADGPATGP